MKALRLLRSYTLTPLVLALLCLVLVRSQDDATAPGDDPFEMGDAVPFPPPQVQESGTSTTISSDQDLGDGERVYECLMEAPCQLEIGKVFGDPFVKTNAGDVKYFQVVGTPQIHPSEVIASLLSSGAVEIYASSGGKMPTVDDHEWGGGNVVRLKGWAVPKGDETLCIMVVSPQQQVAYRLLASSKEAILRLEDGKAVEMVQDYMEYRYFRIDVTDSKTDLSVATTVLHGDPDMYVSLEDPEGRFLPTKENNTWASRSFGGDMLELQAEVMSKYCLPDANESCTYVIGVEALSNCSYYIQASLNHGWDLPRMLVMGNGQRAHLKTGDFHYYALYNPPPVTDEPWQHVVITITPTDGGMQDVYVTTDRARQPGPEDYSVRGSNWAGSFMLLFSETSPGFCTDCYLYVGVYGYKGGDYSIVASQGLTRLLEGVAQQGVLDDALRSSQYYDFFNPYGEGDSVQISLTALSGDPDVYISTGSDELPGPTNFDWVGGSIGSDTVLINSSDPNFCENCAYIMCVTSTTNSSYTIAASRRDEGVIALVPGRPQAGSALAGEMKYYSVGPQSDAATLAVALYPLAGEADLYMQVLEGRGVINPNDTATYGWTSKGLARPIVAADSTIDGTGSYYLIGVNAASDAQFVIVATFKQLKTILQAGVPQMHFLAAGEQMSFSFVVDQDSGVQLIVTTIQGKPALLAGMHDEAPVCTPPHHAGDTLRCEGWTWACNDGDRKSIVISPTDPCRPSSSESTGEASSHVTIANDCASEDFKMGMMHLTVVAEGAMDSRFTVAASALGKHLTLVEGMPQHAITTPMPPCGGLMSAGDGPCSDRGKTDGLLMQQALFSFTAMTSGKGVSLSFLPLCTPDSSGGATCPFGCPCRPAQVYVKACIYGKCLPEERYPGEGNADMKFEVSSMHSSASVADRLATICDPGKRITCVAYVAVVAGGADEVPMRLTASAEVIESTVIPCDDVWQRPDGIVASFTGLLLPADTSKSFELCVPPDTHFQVSLEWCRGKTDVLMCNNGCPSLYPAKFGNQYTQMSDGDRVCTMAHGEARGMQERPECSEQHDGVFVRAATRLGDPAAKYFVAVVRHQTELVSGQEFELKVNVLDRRDRPVTPRLAPKAHPGATAGEFSFAAVDTLQATVAWAGATLISTAPLGDTADEEDVDCRDSCAYDLYAVPSKLHLMADGIEYTKCGLASIGQDSSVISRSFAAGELVGDTKQATLEGLLADEAYDFVVEASCDALCLSDLLPDICGIADDEVQCYSQYAVFPPAARVASTHDFPNTGREGGGASAGEEAGQGGISGGGEEGVDGSIAIPPDADSSMSGHHQVSVKLLALATVVFACVAGVVFSLLQRVSRAGGGAGGGPKMRWLGGGGIGGRAGRGGGVGGRGLQLGAGFELASLRREQPSEDNDEFVVPTVPGRVVGKGKGGRERGPGYASLLDEEEEGRWQGGGSGTKR